MDRTLCSFSRRKETLSGNDEDDEEEGRVEEGREAQEGREAMVERFQAFLLELWGVGSQHPDLHGAQEGYGRGQEQEVEEVEVSELFVKEAHPIA